MLIMLSKNIHKITETDGSNFYESDVIYTTFEIAMKVQRLERISREKTVWQ